MKKSLLIAIGLLLATFLSAQTSVTANPSKDGTFTVSSTNVGKGSKDPAMVTTNELLGFVKSKRTTTITVQATVFEVTYVESSKSYLVATPKVKQQLETLEAVKAVLKDEIYLFIKNGILK